MAVASAQNPLAAGDSRREGTVLLRGRISANSTTGAGSNVVRRLLHSRRCPPAVTGWSHQVRPGSFSSSTATSSNTCRILHGLVQHSPHHLGRIAHHET